MKKIILSKIYSRERSLFYFCMWRDSNRKGYLKWLGYRLKNSFFLCSARSNKVSVYFDKEEYEIIRFRETKKAQLESFISRLEKFVYKRFALLEPYIEGKKTIQNTKGIAEYYNIVVDYWSAMTIIFDIPNLKNISEEIKDRAFLLRKKVEQYSDIINDKFTEYWINKYPKHSELSHIITISETKKAGTSGLSAEEFRQIRKRFNGYALFNKKIYSLEEIEKQLEKRNIFIEKEIVPAKINSFKGTAASKGVVRGKIRLILAKKYISRLRRGEILVATVTSPVYLPAIRKASAIITDEGGLTCHAAIVSRELNIPCVIGTKIATRVLKDGQLVEVDANEGVVRILKE